MVTGEPARLARGLGKSSQGSSRPMFPGMFRRLQKDALRDFASHPANLFRQWAQRFTKKVRSVAGEGLRSLLPTPERSRQRGFTGFDACRARASTHRNRMPGARGCDRRCVSARTGLAILNAFKPSCPSWWDFFRSGDRPVRSSGSRQPHPFPAPTLPWAIGPRPAALGWAERLCLYWWEMGMGATRLPCSFRYP